MSVSDERDKDPNLDEYAYEQRVSNGDEPGLEPAPGADEHADNPHPDADGGVGDPDDPHDPAAPDDPTGVIDPKAD